MVTTLAVVEADGAVDGAVVHRAGVGLAEEAGEVGARVGAALGGDFDVPGSVYNAKKSE